MKYAAAAIGAFFFLCVVLALVPETAPETEIKIVTRTVTETETVVEREAFVPQECISLAANSAEILDVTNDIDSAQARALEIMSNSRIGITQGDQNEITRQDTAMRGLMNETSEMIQTLSGLKLENTDLQDDCQEAIDDNQG